MEADSRACYDRGNQDRSENVLEAWSHEGAEESFGPDFAKIFQTVTVSTPLLSRRSPIGVRSPHPALAPLHPHCLYFHSSKALVRRCYSHRLECPS